mgnify:CR=1 FL=1
MTRSMTILAAATMAFPAQVESAHRSCVVDQRRAA